MPAGPGESIWQPEWSPDGRLHWVSDRDGWWNIFREGEQLTDEQAELGYPQWLLGGSTYDFLPDGSIVCVRVQGAMERLGLLRPGESRLEDLGLPYDAVGYPYVKALDDRVVLVAAGPTEEEAVVSWSAAEGAARGAERQRRAARAGLGAGAAHARIRERGRAHLARPLVAARPTPTSRRRRASCRR